MVMMSEGRCAAPPGMFSARHRYPMTLTGSPSSAIADVAAPAAARGGVVVAGDQRHGDVGRRGGPVRAEAVAAEQRPGGDGLRLGRGLRGKREHDGLALALVLDGQFVPA